METASKALREALQEAETNGMLAAAKIICTRCRNGEPIIQREDESVWHQGTGIGQTACLAWKIRREPRLLDRTSAAAPASPAGRCTDGIPPHQCVLDEGHYGEHEFGILAGSGASEPPTGISADMLMEAVAMVEDEGLWKFDQPKWYEAMASAIEHLIGEAQPPAAVPSDRERARTFFGHSEDGVYSGSGECLKEEPCFKCRALELEFAAVREGEPMTPHGERLAQLPEMWCKLAEHIQASGTFLEGEVRRLYWCAQQLQEALRESAPPAGERLAPLWSGDPPSSTCAPVASPSELALHLDKLSDICRGLRERTMLMDNDTAECALFEILLALRVIAAELDRAIAAAKPL